MLKLNVGLSKKIGLPDYGSRGATVNLELEFDAALVADPERLKDRIRQLFGLAKASVDEELALPRHGNHEGHSDGQANGNGHPAGRRRDGTRPATASQVRALNAIAERQGIELGDKLHAMFGVSDPAQLTITEASGLIDELKSTSGGGGRR
jgi:hypothetical protein